MKLKVHSLIKNIFFILVLWMCIMAFNLTNKDPMSSNLNPVLLHLRNVTQLNPLLLAKKHHFYNKMVNLYGNHNSEFPYNYLINIKDLSFCYDESISTLAFVFMPPSSGNKRKYLRQLWLNDKWTQNTKIKFVHLLGVSTNPQDNRDVLRESGQYKDIIQASFVDSYLNLTLKAITMLHWTKSRCPNIKWIMKIDDDLIPNIFLLSRLKQMFFVYLFDYH